MAAKRNEEGNRSWFSKHQHTIRDWLVLFAAVVAGIVGFVQIADERNARKSAEEDAERVERRAQANEISAWLTDTKSEAEAVMLSNHSNQPVYQAVVSRVTIQANGPYTGRQIPKNISHREQQAVSVLPPGEHRLEFGLGFGGMGKVPGFEIAFRDQEGRNWVRYANGVLKEINQSPISFYGLSRPVYWQMPYEVESR